MPLLQRYGITLSIVQDNLSIPASYWGAPEAGIQGTHVFARSDTPVHSLLHEICHIICMTPERRLTLDRDAGGSDLEESGVCYLQLVLADEINGAGRCRIMQDMDSWGYSFRLGNTRAWFSADADHAKAWLTQHQLLSPLGKASFRLRSNDNASQVVEACAIDQGI